MGRFSSWAQGRAAEAPKEEPVKAAPQKQLFVVDNLQLRSKSNGIRYRCSPDLGDKHSKVALFGSRIQGTPYGGCWIQVGNRFLPTHIGGAEVLRPIEEGSTEGIAVEAPSKDVKEQDKLLGQMLFGRADTDAGYIDQRQQEKSPARTLIRPETSMTDTPLLPVGDGAIYEVLYERVAIRSAASTTSTTLEIKQKGEDLELFEWDSTRKWRRCAADARATTVGWVLLDHPEFGPLVRPKGAPLCARPLEPLCAAAAEGQLGELKRFLGEGHDPCACDAGGMSALALAALADARDCAVHLIEAGAVTTTAAGDAAIRNAGSDNVRALIQALLGHMVEDDTTLQAALADLTLDARLAADRILEQLDEAEAPQLQPAEPRTQPAQPAATPFAAEPEGEPKLPRRKGGKLHEVLHKAVAIRYLPSTTADMVGTRILGQLVELFEESADGKWRKMEDSESGEEGWMLLQHPQLGLLLRPVSDERLE